METPITSIANESDRPSLLQLNDDCLLGIFQYLTMGELNVVKQCSKRLQKTVDQHLTHRFATKFFVVRKIPCRMLQRFGSQMHNISTCSWTQKQLGVDEVKHLRRLCPNLRTLKAHWGFTAAAFSTPELGDIFSGLTKLLVRYMNGITGKYDSDSVKRTMQRCVNLRTLCLTGFSKNGDMFSVEYPQLRELTFCIGHEYPGPKLMTQFFRRHQQIQYLDITAWHASFEWSAILDLQHLKTLHIHDHGHGENLFTRFIEQLSKLPLLTKLIVKAPFREMPNFSKIKHVNRVEITVNGFLPINRGFFKYFAAMANLTKLHLRFLALSENLTWGDIFDFVRTLPPSFKELRASSVVSNHDQFVETYILIHETLPMDSAHIVRNGGTQDSYHFIPRDLNFLPAIKTRI